MKRTLIVSGPGALIIAAAVGVVQGRKPSTSMKKVVYAAADKADFKTGAMKGVTEGPFG